MKLQAFSVYDKAVQAYMTPFFCRSTGEALRSFAEVSNDEKHNIGRHATDFVLFLVGEFDDTAGRFQIMEPARVISAVECVNKHIEAEAEAEEVAEWRRKAM